MMNIPFYDHLAGDEIRTRHSPHSVAFYAGILIVAAVTTAGLVIFGLTAFNRIEPASNTTVISQQPNLPVISNGSAKGSKDTNAGEAEKRPKASHRIFF